ncbi:hypothetical protein TSH100_01750 [Azospirillum sp. TSH100]|uniref:hypothetical protein n=1 Tax=Azospirillum sp. TSH100 TaxID=652764 RepID=UPI000D6176E3|nr:hypothetical protein [Azospirillum sp. TSH100]PWC90781.1 hypothetical protein TSH100_01750 [Azospirillum sp. TSH100]QCG90870.1 hypothetical protein E6C72_24160 [Azospirillum sp. TSH100]
MGQLIYLALCILVGLFAIGQRGGFFLYFLLSMVLSPLLSLLILVIATPVLNKDMQRGSRWHPLPPSSR